MSTERESIDQLPERGKVEAAVTVALFPEAEATGSIAALFRDHLCPTSMVSSAGHSFGSATPAALDVAANVRSNCAIGVPASKLRVSIIAQPVPALLPRSRARMQQMEDTAGTRGVGDAMRDRLVSPIGLVSSLCI